MTKKRTVVTPDPIDETTAQARETNVYFVGIEVTGTGATRQVTARCLKTPTGDPADEVLTFDLGLYLDKYGLDWAALTVYNNPTMGLIVDGLNTPAIKVETDADGVFKCDAVNSLTETVWAAANQSIASHALSCCSPKEIIFA